jgi:hypothetical protein
MECIYVIKTFITAERGEEGLQIAFEHSQPRVLSGNA